MEGDSANEFHLWGGWKFRPSSSPFLLNMNIHLKLSFLIQRPHPCSGGLWTYSPPENKERGWNQDQWWRYHVALQGLPRLPYLAVLQGSLPLGDLDSRALLLRGGAWGVRAKHVSRIRDSRVGGAYISHQKMKTKTHICKWLCIMHILLTLFIIQLHGSRPTLYLQS